MIRIIIGALLLLTFGLAMVGFIVEPTPTQEDVDAMIAAVIILAVPGVGLIAWGASGVRKARRVEREIIAMFNRENRVDVSAVAMKTDAREALVRKALSKLERQGELPGVDV